MSTTNYTIHSPVTGRTLKVSYRGGRFFRLELVSGKRPTAAEIVQMAKVTPPTIDDVAEYRAKYKMLDYVKVEKQQTTYQRYVSAWFAFYGDFMGMAPKFTGADGKALTQIKNYLTREAGTEQLGLDLFKTVLAHWHKLDDFHKENTDLKYINSRLNVILNALKKANKAHSGGAGDGVRF